MSLTTLGDGRHELVARARAGSAVDAHFVSAEFTLTAAPAGIEIVDGVIDSAVEARRGEFCSAVAQAAAFHRAAAGHRDSCTHRRARSRRRRRSLQRWAVRGSPGAREAAEKPVLASGVFVVEDLAAGLDYGAPFMGRRALDDDNLHPPVIHENLGGGVYRFVFPQNDLRTSLPQGTSLI